MPKLLLIRGLGHSGTTILDLALGAHPSMLGLGEAVRVLKTPAPAEMHRGPARLRAELRHQRLCTCGATAADCPIWGGVLEWLPTHDHLPLHEKLNQLLNGVESHARRQNLAVEWVIDSYQDDLELPLGTSTDLDIRIVFLVRDVRSWVYSRSRDAQQKGQPLPRLRSLMRWCLVNRRFEQKLRACGKPLFLMGYEEFALDPERSLVRLCEWLGVEFFPLMLHPGLSSKSHLLAGNRMRFNASKNRRIFYDYRWMQSSGWPASFALALPWVKRMNQRLAHPQGLRSS